MMERLMRPLSAERTRTFTVWPSCKKSCTSLTKVLAISEICTSPDLPSGSETKAPNFVIPVTFPSKTEPTSNSI